MAEIRHKIRQLRDEKNLSRADFAELIEEKPSKIADIENGNQRINDIFLTKLIEKFSLDANWLFGTHKTEVAKSNSVSIPKYDLAMSAGTGNLSFSDPSSEAFEISSQWIEQQSLNPKHLCVFPVRGDSMERDLRDGDLIIVDRSQTHAIDGATYALRFEDDMLVKKIQHLPGRSVRLISNNPTYPPIEIPADPADGSIAIIGRVVTSIRQF